jgi:hypothetical protein
MTNAPVWECQRSVDADVPASFAWAYMTNLANWSDPPAEFALDGPFAAGSRGTTWMPGQPARSWVIRAIDPGRAYTIENAFFGGVLLIFHWRFDALSGRRTRMTQRIELFGQNADAYVEQIRAGFEPNLEPGMRRIAESMARAASHAASSPENA